MHAGSLADREETYLEGVGIMTCVRKLRNLGRQGTQAFHE